MSNRNQKSQREKHQEASSFIPDRRELSELIREACPVCKRVTPHVHGVCSWHSRDEDILTK